MRWVWLLLLGIVGSFFLGWGSHSMFAVRSVETKSVFGFQCERGVAIDRYVWFEQAEDGWSRRYIAMRAGACDEIEQGERRLVEEGL